MGLLPSSIRLLLHLHKHYKFESPVLTLGNQEIWATTHDLQSYMKESGITPDSQVLPTPHTSNMFKQNPTLANLSKDFVHAKTFFNMMGIKDYFDMDIYDSDKPYFIHDMNYPVDAAMHNKFSFILDGGTIEHIFDMKQVMKNIINMSKLNGCVVHICSFNIDHGFYAISPCFFYEFYALNGFSDFKCYIVQIDPSDLLNTYKDENICFEYKYGMNFNKLIDSNKMILLFFSARKTEIKPFKIPTQGIFNPNPTNDECINNELLNIIRIFKNYIYKNKIIKKLI